MLLTPRVFKKSLKARELFLGFVVCVCVCVGSVSSFCIASSVSFARICKVERSRKSSGLLLKHSKSPVKAAGKAQTHAGLRVGLEVRHSSGQGELF